MIRFKSEHQLLTEQKEFLEEVIKRYERLRDVLKEKYSEQPEDKITHARIGIELTKLYKEIRMKQSAYETVVDNMREWMEAFEVRSQETNEHWDSVLADARRLAVTNDDIRLLIQSYDYNINNETKHNAEVTEQELRNYFFSVMRQAIENVKKGKKRSP